MSEENVRRIDLKEPVVISLRVLDPDDALDKMIAAARQQGHDDVAERISIVRSLDEEQKQKWLLSRVGRPAERGVVEKLIWFCVIKAVQILVIVGYIKYKKWCEEKQSEVEVTEPIYEEQEVEQEVCEWVEAPGAGSPDSPQPVPPQYQPR